MSPFVLPMLAREARASWKRLLLFVLCIAAGDDGETAAIVPGAELPEGISDVAAEICRELQPSAVPQELLPTAAADGDSAGGTREEAVRILADPEVEVRWLTTRRPLAAVLREAAAVQAELVLAAKQAAREKRRRTSLARKLFTAAPCHTMLLRIGGDVDAGRCHRILVPSAGGPHARVALRLGEKLASAVDGELVALYVVPDEGEAAPEVGRQLLANTLDEADVDGLPVDRRATTLGLEEPRVLSRQGDGVGAVCIDQPHEFP